MTCANTCIVAHAAILFCLVSSARADLYVANFDTSNVVRYTASGSFVETFVPAGAGGLNAPLCLLFGPDANLYVGSQNPGPPHGQVLRFQGTSGAFIDVFASDPGLFIPDGLAFGADRLLYAANFNQDNILRFNAATGAFVDVFAAGGELNGPQGLIFGPDGRLYVNSFYNHSVLRYDATGAFQGSFTSGGPLNQPSDLVFGPDNNLYVTSIGTNSVLRYNGTTGSYIDTFASGGGLAAPRGLVFGPDGNLYVASFDNNSILRYDGSTGAFLGTVAIGGELHGPEQLKFFPPIPEPTTWLLATTSLMVLFGIKSILRNKRTWRIAA